jgi:hypothetical protein
MISVIIFPDRSHYLTQTSLQKTTHSEHIYTGQNVLSSNMQNTL